MKFSSAAGLSLGGLLIVGIAAPVTAQDAHALQADTRHIDTHEIGAQDMGAHMEMTKPRPIQPGDRERADAVAAAARKVAEQYVDYRKALADGWTIYAGNIPQPVYHFTRDDHFVNAIGRFDPAKPTSLLYIKTTTDGQPGYKLIGVMYTDRYGAPESELNQRIPLSIAQWHVHTDICLPRWSEKVDMSAPDARFGPKGSITTEAACTEAGGRFYPHLLGWMVHVYPFESDPAKVWNAGPDDEHGMQHDAMPGMKMGPE